MVDMQAAIEIANKPHKEDAIREEQDVAKCHSEAKFHDSQSTQEQGQIDEQYNNTDSKFAIFARYDIRPRRERTNAREATPGQMA